jgi:hypothetical protein
MVQSKLCFNSNRRSCAQKTLYDGFSTKQVGEPDSFVGKMGLILESNGLKACGDRSVSTAYRTLAQGKMKGMTAKLLFEERNGRNGLYTFSPRLLHIGT